MRGSCWGMGSFVGGKGSTRAKLDEAAKTVETLHARDLEFFCLFVVAGRSLLFSQHSGDDLCAGHALAFRRLRPSPAHPRATQARFSRLEQYWSRKKLPKSQM